MVINWPNFNIVVSQEIGKPDEKKLGEGIAGSWSSHNAHNTYQLSSSSYMGEAHGASKQLQE